MLQQLVQRLGLHTAICKGCRVNLRNQGSGQLLQKGWKIVTTHALLAEVLHCPCRCDLKYQHGKCEGPAATASALYTKEFAEKVAGVLLQELSFQTTQAECSGRSQLPAGFGVDEGCLCDGLKFSGVGVLVAPADSPVFPAVRPQRKR